jgi:predicted ATPase
VLHGRWLECARLDNLLAGARASRSQALVIRGEPGIGKSALLGWARDRAAPARCLHASAVESELELPFAVLHQLLYPVLGRLEALPAVQADALRGALGMAPGRGEDRFLVAVAVLTLLADVAAGDGLVCAVDDVQWADSASVDALVSLLGGWRPRASR